MQIVVFVGLFTGTLHMLSGILRGQPVTISNPISVRTHSSVRQGCVRCAATSYSFCDSAPTRIVCAV